MDGVTLEETMVYTAAGEIRNGAHVFVGTGLPMLAAYLAKGTHAPDVTLLFESGIIDPRAAHLALGVGDFRLLNDASGVRGLHYVLSLLQRNVIDVGFLGAAEADAYGNINSTFVGGDYRHPKKRLPGSGGANDIASLAKATVIMCQHRPERLVERVQYITSPGFLGGGDEREKAGLTGGGPVMLITDMAVFRFDPVTKRAYASSIHAGVDPAEAAELCGFDVEITEKTPRTPEPDAATVALLRSLDPDGVYLRNARPKDN
ncbi:CoA-transferase [Microbacterium sp. BWT-B31]|uniref:CoA-transferase subunit beta n=1 Tax=Microbacterium sp. BWT-B31 TaxID=3232072 RepID=UPI0035289934